MANGLHGKNLAQSETLCTWRSSLRGTWQVSSMPGLVCRAGSGNRIDFSVLRDLTDQDLKDLGVALGDRRKMLRAIGEFSAASLAAPAITAEPVSPDAAERRQVTVMFSDLVGSTALSARMDPEDLREVISSYQKCVAEPVQRFGGFVAKYMGDGVLVYFGYCQFFFTEHALHSTIVQRNVSLDRLFNCRVASEPMEAIEALKKFNG
jgi:hypothetical protein